MLGAKRRPRNREDPGPSPGSSPAWRCRESPPAEPRASSVRWQSHRAAQEVWRQQVSLDRPPPANEQGCPSPRAVRWPSWPQQACLLVLVTKLQCGCGQSLPQGSSVLIWVKTEQRVGPPFRPNAWRVVWKLPRVQGHLAAGPPPHGTGAPHRTPNLILSRGPRCRGSAFAPHHDDCHSPAGASAGKTQGRSPAFAGFFLRRTRRPQICGGRWDSVEL